MFSFANWRRSVKHIKYLVTSTVERENLPVVLADMPVGLVSDKTTRWYNVETGTVWRELARSFDQTGEYSVTMINEKDSLEVLTIPFVYLCGRDRIWRIT